MKDTKLSYVTPSLKTIAVVARAVVCNVSNESIRKCGGYLGTMDD